MSENAHPGPDEDQPDPRTEEASGEATEAADVAPETVRFRVPPSAFARTDLSDILGIQAATRRLTEQWAETNRRNMEALLASVQRVQWRPPAIPAAQWAASIPSLQNGLVEQIRQAARVSVPVPQYDFGLDLGRILNAGAPTWLANIRTVIERLQETIPENLRDLSVDDLKAVFRLNVEDGTSLAWAPRTSIVEELLQATDMGARGTILVDHASEIADDVQASLTHVTQTEHETLRDLLLEAAEALRTGLYGPAQAAACNVFDTVMNVHMLNFLAYNGSKTKDKTRNHFRPADDFEDVTFAEVELVLVGGGIATAFEFWTAGSGPASFNRNGSVHHVDDGAYSAAHAVRALLIAHAALRWLDTAIAEEDEDEDAA
ncbi:hypothetical protein DMH25_08155 [Streptomyces sp. WAC 01325]|uniref:hypothetical protein n=1 Tax=Streptomyces sp. WAC 01325 TaxID=2203202 RepID=UPI0010025A04|nr:hypothetical protein [Streptomyces sp. WAC 01325]RSN13753.1 hypothetical protein DMH25_08155 [Streptomyces sp. WAC 01325]